jgi:glycosyltransferase involved in cell wall biosynthesis
VILGLLTVLLRPLIGYRLILDLHNESVEPFVNNSALYKRLITFLHRSADLCLVTTEPLCQVVLTNGGRPWVLPDRVPAMEPAALSGPRLGPAEIVFVCSFAADEPFVEVIEAARLLGDTVVLHVTGRPPASFAGRAIPPNVRLTGFLPDSEYERLLREASAIIDLTAMENCLVCGAYEAVALGKPLVTSDTAALRSYFRRGTVHTRHDAPAIASAVRQVLANIASLESDMRRFRPELDFEWKASFNDVVTVLSTSVEREHEAGLRAE